MRKKEAAKTQLRNGIITISPTLGSLLRMKLTAKFLSECQNFYGGVAKYQNFDALNGKPGCLGSTVLPHYLAHPTPHFILLSSLLLSNGTILPSCDLFTWMITRKPFQRL